MREIMAVTGRATTRRLMLFVILAISSTLVFLVTTRPTRENPRDVTGHRRIMNVGKNDEQETFDNRGNITMDDNGKYVVKWDPNGKTWQLWKDNPSAACSQYRTRFALGLPRTYLVSFPGSGNTWTRYLLEAASGIFTGAVYRDQEILKAGHLGEADAPDSGRTLVQKTHGTAIVSMKNTMKNRYEVIRADLPCILIIRNPARSIVSFWKYYKLKGKDRHTKQLPEASFQTQDFRNFVVKMTTLWEQLISDRLLWSSAPIHVVYYEQLVQDPIFYVKEMLEFLRIPIDDGRLQCLEDHLQGSFKRPNKKETDPYSEEEKLALSYAVKRVKRLLRIMGYAEMPVYGELS